MSVSDQTYSSTALTAEMRGVRSRDAIQQSSVKGSGDEKDGEISHAEDDSAAPESAHTAEEALGFQGPDAYSSGEVPPGQILCNTPTSNVYVRPALISISSCSTSNTW